MSSLLFYNVENSKNKEKSLNVQNLVEKSSQMSYLSKSKDTLTENYSSKS